MKALITGGMGFIGSHLCEFLLSRGHSVTVIDDLSTGRQGNLAAVEGHERLRCYVDTIRNKPLMEQLLQETEVAFHLAAVVGVRSVLNDPLRCLDTNIRGTDMLLELSHKYGVKVLLASSSEVYGKNGDATLDENANRLLGPTTVTRWIYSTTKAVDEYLALGYSRERGLPVVVVRFFNTVGPRQSGQYGMVLPTFVQQALAGKPITVYGDGRQIRCFTYVSDVVRAVTSLAEHDAALGEIINIGGSEPVSIGELARRVKELTRSDSTIEYVPYEVAYGEKFEDTQKRVPDIEKLRTLVGYQLATKLDDMIRHIISYFREQQARQPGAAIAPSPSGAPVREVPACAGR